MQISENGTYNFLGKKFLSHDLFLMKQLFKNARVSTSWLLNIKKLFVQKIFYFLRNSEKEFAFKSDDNIVSFLVVIIIYYKR